MHASHDSLSRLLRREGVLDYNRLSDQLQAVQSAVVEPVKHQVPASTLLYIPWGNTMKTQKALLRIGHAIQPLAMLAGCRES